jgi:hypothetical protein
MREAVELETYVVPVQNVVGVVTGWLVDRGEGKRKGKGDNWLLILIHDRLD